MQTQPPPHQAETEQEASPARPLPAARSTATPNAIIGWVLQGGVLFSAAVIVLGLLLELLQPNKFAPQKLQNFPQTFDQVWAGLLVLRPQAVITLGLLLLIATPVMRVAVSVVTFVVERDRRFVVITLLVLCILLGALLGARVLARLSSRFLRLIFLAVIAVAAVEMILRGLGIA